MASLLLGDLNDYIEPSQACVLPVNKPDDEQKKEGQPISINLTDCLACSGCITSAETVLVAQQTYNKLCEAVDSGKYQEITVSVSPQTVAALSIKYDLGMDQVWRRLNWFFKHRLGVSRVIDTSLSRCITLACLAEEFIEGFKNKKGPLIVSACPGWICYAEKRYSEFLPFLSTTRSPQQMAGVLVKHYYLREREDIKASDVYHCTVMPCFDKKLEASREDFVADILLTRDVDTVITTTELIQILEERGDLLFMDIPEEETADRLFRHEGSGSGGYLDYVLQYAAPVLFPGGQVQVVPGRNSDMTEYNYVVDGQVRLRFASIYGFRNIQTFVIKNKKRGPVYDFVEIMACPSGCLNGGGQPKSEDSSRQGQKEHNDNLNAAYKSTPVIDIEPPLVKQFLHWITEHQRTKLIRASYKAVADNDSLKKTINVQW